MFLLIKIWICYSSGPWKKKNLTEYGIVTQCMAPVRQPNDQYLTNCLLKINAKVISVFLFFLCTNRSFCFLYTISDAYTLQLGGLNSMLSVERTPAFTVISKVPTIILGMDVSHGSPGQSDVPSIAAVIHFTLYYIYCLLLHKPFDLCSFFDADVLCMVFT